MISAAKALECLLDRDGSTRDVTFTPASADALRSFLANMVATYSVTSARDKDGNDIAERLRSSDFDDLLAVREGYIHAVFSNDRALIKTLLAFVCWGPGEDGHFVEVSFFPDDIAVDRFDLPSFLDILSDWNRTLNAADYFVRYESAGWEPYDAGGVSVIFTRSSPPTVC